MPRIHSALTSRISLWIASLAVGLACAAPAAQMPNLKYDSSPIPRKTGSVTSYAPVVSNVAPSVVSVYTRKRMSRALPFLQDPMLRRFFGFDGKPREEQALGSGVIISADGYILTNSHVVEGADEIRVSTPDGVEHVAKLIGADSPTDVAVIKIDGNNLPAATLADSANVRVGDVVLAIGNPFGVGQTVTMGIVSATERTGLGITEYEDFIQTDASINPGNSGGPLVDVEGRVVGLNTAIFSRSGGSLGIGFAVPVSLARSVMTQLVTQGKVVRGFLGVSVQTLTPDLAREFNTTNIHGALVAGVSPNSPAAKAGFQEGDIITELNNQPVENARALRMSISQMKPGTETRITVLRNGKTQTLTANIGEMPRQQRRSTAPNQNEGVPPESVLEGVEVQDLDREARQQLQVPQNIKGVVVTGVDENSPAGRAGLREGDIITEANRKRINSVDDLVSAVQRGRAKSVLLRIWSEGTSHYIVIPKAQGGGGSGSSGGGSEPDGGGSGSAE